MADKTITVRLQALVGGYQTAMARATASTQAFGTTALKAAGENQTAFRSLGLGAVVMGAAIVGSLAAAASAAIDFESSFAGVRKTVDGTEEELGAISEGLREMATQIPVNVNELNRIAEAAGALGISRTGILDFTETVAKLGVTTTLATDDAANGLARIANIMGTAEEDFDRLGSSIVALGNAGASTEPEIVEFGLRIAGAGRIAGLTEGEILGMANAFLSMGIPVESGGTAVQKALLGITSAVATGNDNLEVFASTAGMSVQKFSKMWQDDAAGAFVAFVEGLAASGNQGIGTLQELFGVNERVARTFLSMAQNAGLLSEQIDLGNQSWEENNALTEEAAKRFGTTASKIQLAKNEINDAAISFGALLLPAIGAVVGALGDVAAFIGDLPGPVKVAVLAFSGLAGALLLVSGAMLILAPRIAQIQALMTAAGIQTGVFRGSLMLAARAINPFTVALTVATIGFTMYAQESQRAKTSAEEFAAAVEADTGALGANTRALLVNKLGTAGLLSAYEALGMSGADVTDALLDFASATAAGDVAAAKAAFSMLRVTDLTVQERIALTKLINELEAGAKLEGEKARATDEGAGADKNAAGATDEHADALVGLQGELEETRTLAEQLEDALMALAGFQISAERAAIRYQESLAAMRETLKGANKGLEGNSKAALENRSAILDAAEAAIEHGTRVADETGSLNAGVKATQAHIRELINEAVQAGASEEEVRNYIRTLNLTPKQISTLIEAKTDKARNQLDAFIRTYDGRVIAITVREKIERHGGSDVHHAGGMVGASGATRMQSGSPSLRGNEFSTILERGEVVLSKSEARHGTGGSGGPKVMSIVGVLDTKFGPAEVRGIAREEIGSERAFDDRLARTGR